jgi:hypothetical protein
MASRTSPIICSRSFVRARQIATARAGKLSAAQEARFQRLEEVLGVAASKE